MKPFTTPAEAMRLTMQSSMMLAEANMVIAMRMLGMGGMWRVTPSENARMVQEKIRRCGCLRCRDDPRHAGRPKPRQDCTGWHETCACQNPRKCKPPCQTRSGQTDQIGLVGLTVFKGLVKPSSRILFPVKGFDRGLNSSMADLGTPSLRQAVS